MFLPRNLFTIKRVSVVFLTGWIILLCIWHISLSLPETKLIKPRQILPLSSTQYPLPLPFAIEGDSFGTGLLDSATMPMLGNATLKAELGQATWKLIHTIVARYPIKPNSADQESLRMFFYLLAKLFPCGQCAAHFQTLLKRYPPVTTSRYSASQWACDLHNKVNLRLQHPQFDCRTVLDVWKCGCGDEEPTKRLETNTNATRTSNHTLTNK